MESSAFLTMQSITKDYPGVRALDHVDFEVAQAEVHALVGENGAGKSTLMKILSGAERADEGMILLEGQPLDIHSPHDAMAAGIATIYQEFNLVPYLSVAENIFLGREPTRFAGFIDWGKMRADAEAVLARIGADIAPTAQVQSLSVARQQMVEIAKAISMDSRIIVMDEPSAALSETELNILFEQVRALREQGVSVIYISHRLQEIFEVADRVTVLRDGRLVGTRPVSDVDTAEVVRMMVGRTLDADVGGAGAATEEVALRVEGLCRKGVLKDITLALHKGEILGISGLVGAGRTELARAIFGADPRDAGRIFMDGEEVSIRSPVDAIRHGIGLVTEDRKLQGLVLGMAVKDNITLASLEDVSTVGFVRRRDEAAAAAALAERLAIRTPSLTQLVRNLSGGNQQKVVLAKWLFTRSRVLIFDEPTRGIDVGSKAEIHELMRDLARSGVGIIMISSELPEILKMSDRILVMHEGRIAGELRREDATQEAIMLLATGGAPSAGGEPPAADGP
jgi:ribose transport system ATP-binding protein